MKNSSRMCLIVVSVLTILMWKVSHFITQVKDISSDLSSNSGDNSESVKPEKLKLRQSNTPHKKDKKSSNDDIIHLVFSTDCTYFQDWQSIVVFHSAIQVGQKGQITRIASGCKPEKQTELRQLYAKLFPTYHVHFTPDFKKDGKTGKSYDFYNKPYGMEHWLTHAEPPLREGTIVALIDPDFVFLRPVNLHFGRDNNLIPMKTDTNFSISHKYQKGVAVGQYYGIHAPWTDENNEDFNKTRICGADSPCLKVDQSFGEDHYSVGPPYLLEKSDMLRLTRTWAHFVPKVFEKNQEFLSEMYAYSMAAAHEELPHVTMEHFMVSNVEMDREGWKFIDSMEDDVCKPPVHGIYYPGQPLPTFIHHCQLYHVGDFGFYKRHVPNGLFECNQPLMAETPVDLGKLRYKISDGKEVPLTPVMARRNAFMLCALHQSINAAIIYYRLNTCPDPATINYDKSINLDKLVHY